ncbi:MAG: LytR C-terminal domain-containing protein, partial [Mycobacterium sp.]
AGLATKVASALDERGYTTGEVRDRDSGEPTGTTIQYGAGAGTDAHAWESLLGIDADQPDSSLGAGHIRIVLGMDYYLPPLDDEITPTSTTISSYDQSGGYATTSTEPPPDEGKPIDGGGIPCVN